MQGPQNKVPLMFGNSHIGLKGLRLWVLKLWGSRFPPKGWEFVWALAGTSVRAEKGCRPLKLMAGFRVSGSGSTVCKECK